MSDLHHLAGYVGDVFREARGHAGDHKRAEISGSDDCATCLRAAVFRLIDEGATDGDLQRPFDGALTTIPERRYLWALVAEVKALQSEPPAMTSYARDKIREIGQMLGPIRRNGGREPSIRSMATRVGVDRDTLVDWIDRGWLASTDWHPTRKKSAT